MRQYMVKTFRNRRLEAGFLICLSVFLVVPACIAGEKKDAAYPELPLGEMRIVAYTKAFAERFGLPAPKPGTEPSGGLEAIEFAIEKGPAWAPLYYCNYYLYVDSTLPIKFPEVGGAGNVYMLVGKTHFLSRTHEQWMKWPLEDRKYSSNLKGKYNRKANLASMDYIPNKQGAIDSLLYVEYYKNLLPGLSYVKLDAPPPMIIDSQRKNIGIWLQKESKTDYGSQVHVDPGDFLKFPIPEQIFEKVREWGLKAREANTVIRPTLKEKRDEQ